MTDQQHAAGVVAERLRQRRFALHIQMVGGFIQQQQAVARQRQTDEQQPRPLAAAEGADLLSMPRPAKPGGNQRPFTGVRRRGERRQGVEQAGLVRQLRQGLVVVPGVKPGVQTQPRKRRCVVHLLPQQAQQGRFPAAVAAHDGHAIAAAQSRHAGGEQGRQSRRGSHRQPVHLQQAVRRQGVPLHHQAPRRADAELGLLVFQAGDLLLHLFGFAGEIFVVIHPPPGGQPPGAGADPVDLFLLRLMT